MSYNESNLTTIIDAQQELIATVADATFALPLQSGVRDSVIALMEDPTTSLADIARTISFDPALAVRLLNIINSAFYGLNERITDITKALQLMGLGAAREVAEGMSLSRLFSLRKTDDPAFSARQEGLWRHSVATGAAAEIIGRKARISNDIICFTAGFLHDIGKSAMLTLQTAEYNRILNIAKNEKVSLFIVERRVLGYDHAMLGRLLCNVWGQPDEIGVAVGRSHSVRSGAVDQPYSMLAAVTHMADIFARSLGVGWWGDRIMPRLDPAASLSLGLAPEDAADLLDEVAEEYKIKMAQMSRYYPVILL